MGDIQIQQNQGPWESSSLLWSQSEEPGVFPHV